MRVLCTGPESSGTRFLTRIVATGCEAFHLSMPNGREWWDAEQVEFDRAVVIVRDRDITAKSAVRARHVRGFAEGVENRAKALRVLADLSPALWTSYEGLVADPDGWLSVLSSWLGVGLVFPEAVVDGNEKWEER